MSNDLLLRRRMLMQAGSSPTPPTPIVLQPFSVSASLQVYFSLGNLQWSATNGGTTATTHNTADGTAEGTWRFAEHQWDWVGDASVGNVYGVGGNTATKCNNNNKAQTYQGWVDLFGFGTSGYNSVYPYLKVNDNNSYPAGSISGTYYDWGVYNDIYNPQTLTTDIAGTWRMLSKDEWDYMLYTRSTTSGIRYAKAVVNGVNGVILVPDTWDSSLTLNDTNTASAAFNTNVLTSSEWRDYEVLGCVFLPLTGYLLYGAIFFYGYEGFYWKDYKGGTYYDFRFSNNAILNDYKAQPSGLAVRLVKDVI